MFQQEDFTIETTLTTKSYLNTIKLAQRMHYKVNLLFFWLNYLNLAVKRVEKRVIEGGHHIPEDVVTRGYLKGIENLKSFIDLVDNWIVLNNSEDPFQFIAKGNKNEIVIFEKEIFEKLIC